MFTAAHCVVNAGGSWTTRTFSPRRRGSTFPYGSSTQWGTTWPVAYTSNNCHTMYSGLCWKYDFAVMVLPDPPTFTSHPGWLGVATASDSTMASWYRANAGYPRCDGPNTPANCASREPYGDIFGCSGIVPVFDQGTTSNSWPFGDGANPRAKTGCDANGGHSGGPIYTSSAGSNGPYIMGNIVANICTTCAPGTDYSTAGVRINGTLGTWMIGLRSTYP